MIARTTIATAAIVRIARTIVTLAIAMTRTFAAVVMMRIVIAIARSANIWRLCAHTAQRQSALTMSLTRRS